MARIVKRLTTKEIEAARASEKEYFLFDGDNLRLKITPNNVKIWIYAFEFAGKQKKISIGQFKKSGGGVGFTLEQARVEKEKFKVLLAQGVCPINQKKALKQKILDDNQQQKINRDRILNQIVTDYFEFITITSESHKKRQISRINRGILVILGDKTIDDISSKDIIDCINKIQTIEEKHRVLTLCGQIWRWAKSNDRVDRNVIVDIDKKNSLPKLVHTKHYRTITKKDEIRELLKSINDYKGDISTKTALQLAPYVALRPYNIRFAEWAEIDFDKKLWLIPASKMKTKNEHIVPLTDTMIKIINTMKPFSFKSKYIFPSPISNTKPISENTINYALKRLGYGDKIVSHGFRAMFSTVANEYIDDDDAHCVSRDIIEFQLAHKIDNKVGAAYNRALYLKQRTKLIAWWSDFLDELQKN